MSITTSITVNGGPECASGTVADLLTARTGDPEPSGVAVAINDDVVPRGQWPTRFLRDGDRVEIVTAVQGG